jgi:hypothetical protein
MPGVWRRRDHCDALIGHSKDAHRALERESFWRRAALHPVSSLVLGALIPPAFKEARMKNVLRNYTYAPRALSPRKRELAASAVESNTTEATSAMSATAIGVRKPASRQPNRPLP